MPTSISSDINLNSIIINVLHKVKLILLLTLSGSVEGGMKWKDYRMRINFQ